MILYKLSSVTKIKSGKKILDNISCEIDKGKIFVIMGPSGSGKTTLLRLLNRLEDPSEGEMFFNGEDIKKIDVRELRKKVAMVFQIPLLFGEKAVDNILYPAKLYKIEVNPEEVIELVGLKRDILNQKIDSVSVGQAQRIAIARSLVLNPDVLLLDEPTSALDFSSKIEIENLIKDLNKNLGISIIFVTHDLEQAKRMGDRAVLIVEGKKIEEGSIPEMFENPRSSELKKFLKGELK